MTKQGLDANHTILKVMIDFYEHTRNIKKLLELTAEVIKNLSTTDVFTVNKIVKVLFQFDQYQEINRIFQKIEDTEYTVDLTFINFQLQFYLENENYSIDYLEKIKDLIKQLNLQPNIITHNLILNHYVKLKEYDFVDIHLKQMQNNGIEPNIATYGILMNQHAENRNLVRCEQYFEEL